MNVWITRGLQTALLTGGLLALGSGIASADDGIDVTVPVTVTDNAVAVLGTSPGSTAPETTLPAVTGTVSADLGAATLSLPVTVVGNSADAAGLDVAQSAAAPAPAGQDGTAVDVDVPVTVAGNAVAVLGDATAAGSPGPSSDAGIEASGTGSEASVADVDAPVTVCGNGIGVLGDATATCTTPVAGGAAATPAEPGTGTAGNGVVAVGITDVRPVGSDLPAGGTATVDTTGTGSLASATGGMRNLGSTAGSAVTSVSGTVGSVGRSGGALASTGGELVPLALVGLVALLLGLGLSVRARRPGIAPS